MARRRRGRKSKVSPVVLGLLGLGGAAALYFALKPSTASAAPLPAPTRAASTPPPRTAATQAKPQMPADLVAVLNGSDFAKLAFWALGAQYQLDPTVGAPTAARVRAITSAGEFDSIAKTFFRANGHEPSDFLGDLTWLYTRVKSTRFSLPYQVPSSIWDYINAFFKTVFGEEAPSSVEPR